MRELRSCPKMVFRESHIILRLPLDVISRFGFNIALMGLLTEHLCRNIYDETQIKLRPLSSVIIANALSPS